MNELAYIHGEPENVIPVYISWRLNERMYGDLQGQNKTAILEEYGAEQVHIWRRSFDVTPPNGESLELVAGRTIPYLEETIFPALESGKNVFITAHGNSLRSIIMYLEGLSIEEVKGLEVPIGEPIIFDKVNGKYTRR
jgi:2,3-bisphosphoglycerate-dependent phosphoglycerate mutase